MIRLLIFLMACVGLGASEYYVATTGSDSTGDGAIGTPWATYSHAFSNIVGGDTVFMRTGTYTEPRIDAGSVSVFPSGTAVDTPTKWMNYNGEAVTIQPSDASGSSAAYAFLMGNFNTGNPTKSNLWFQGMTVDLSDFDDTHSGTENHGGFLFSRNLNVTVTNMVFTNLPAGYGFVVTSRNKSVEGEGGCTNLHLVDCTFNEWSYGSFTRADSPHCIYLGGDVGSTIERLTLVKTSATDFAQSYGIHIYYSGQPSGYGVSNVLRNISIRTTGRAAFFGGQQASTHVYNCLFATTTSSHNTVTLYDNTGFSLDNCTIYGGANGLFLNQYGTTSGCLFRNNLIWGMSSAAIRTILVETANYFTNNIASIIVDEDANQVFSGTITASPALVDPPTDLQLGNNSAAIDAGIDLSALFSTDYAGITRPEGAEWDIGAFEDEVSSPPAFVYPHPIWTIRQLTVGSP